MLAPRNVDAVYLTAAGCFLITNYKYFTVIVDFDMSLFLYATIISQME